MSTPTIVLAHGIARFDQLLAVKGWNAYFKHVPRHLAAQGFDDVHEPTVGFADSLATRAETFARNIAEIAGASPGNKVHVIGHSMGGLDARVAITDHGADEHIASLTTIGTPHLGTSLADVVLDHGGGDAIALLRPLIDLDGFKDLTTTACQARNSRQRDAEARNDVVYSVYSAHQLRRKVVAPLRPAWDIIHSLEGNNDGLVPVTSQNWAATLKSDDGTIEKPVIQHEFGFGADHLNETGWWHLAVLKPSLRFWKETPSLPWTYERRVRNVYLRIARAASGVG